MGRTIRIALVALVLTSVATLIGSGPPASAELAPESGSNDWRSVSIGSQHTCGIRTTGRLYCWGEDDLGQLGDGGGPLERTVPQEVFGGGTDWRTVSAGGRHTCAIRAPGRLYCWGSDQSGELGNGAVLTDEQITPMQVGAATNWVSVSSGAVVTCGRRSTGRLYCWGSDAFGGLGNGPDEGSKPAPNEVFGHLTSWKSFSVGVNHVCGRRSNGRLYCWGRDNEGQLGDNIFQVNQQVPRPVAGGATNWTSVSSGVAHTCGRRSNGRLYCWGDNFGGAVGDGGDPNYRTTPAQVAGGATNWTSVSAGGGYTCGRRSTGRLFCWGSDSNGQLGNGGANAVAVTPSPLAGGATDWVSVEAGDSTTCARISTRRLYCWGDDAGGQLGDGGTDTDQSRPTEVYA